MTDEDIQLLNSMLDEGQAEAVLAEVSWRGADDWVALYLKALALNELGRQGEALVATQAAVALNPSDQRLWQAAIILMRERASNDEFIALLTAYLDHFPDDLLIRYDLGSFFSKEGRWAEALREFDRSITLSPQGGLAHFGKVIALTGAGQFDAASNALTEGKSLRPCFSPQAAIELNAEGLALAAQERWGEAADHFRSAISANIELDEAHYNLGVALNRIGALDFMPFEPQPAAFRRLRDLYYAMSVFESSTSSWKSVISTWQTRELQKFPTDLVVYHQILWDTKPTLIIECGTFDGGSALYFASLFDMAGEGRVISVDIQSHPSPPRHPRVEYITGSSIAPHIIQRVREAIRPDDRVMVILDSNHEKTHVAAELAAYHDVVTPGCYLVVEDSSVDLSPVANRHYQNGGPLVAIADFIGHHREYVIDRRREKYLLTVAPYGFMYRIPN